MIRSYTNKDVDYIVNSHYELYKKEFNYDSSFRSYIAETVNSFIVRSNKKENIFILEIEGKPSGSISIKQVAEHTAQLGLFLIEPHFRGSGYGKDRIIKALSFCVDNGFNKVILWTNEELEAARFIYQKIGFKLKITQRSILSNKVLLEEQWELELKDLHL
ncbi:GNAT family N-acetyltransferase [Paenibacillus pabuli]|uniref:GNAT family N-acetyltransferase n=1 Tax=Paenibacillus pabuli TaxID=1472 RepID=UPI0034599829